MSEKFCAVIRGAQHKKASPAPIHRARKGFVQLGKGMIGSLAHFHCQCLQRDPSRSRLFRQENPHFTTVTRTDWK